MAPHLMTLRPRIIALEGLPGAGKTSLFRRLKNHYATSPHLVFVPERSKTKFGRWLGGSAKSGAIHQWSAHLKNLLFIGDRTLGIEEALRQNPNASLFIVDRHILSPIAFEYQFLIPIGDALVFDERFEQYKAKVKRLFGELPEAELTLYLDVDIDRAMRRKKGGDPAFIGRTKATYEHTFSYTTNLHRLDANTSKDKLLKTTCAILDPLLKEMSQVAPPIPSRDLRGGMKKQTAEVGD